MATALPSSPEFQIQSVYTPLSPEQIRWYYYKAAYNFKGLTTNPEIPHRGTLLRFCDADNAAIETTFRSQSEAVERSWWEEEAELGTAKGGSPSEVGLLQEALAWKDFMTVGTEGDKAGEAVGVLVRSGVYEVDLHRRLLRPCYWPADCHRVLRGTWFVEKAGDWLPLKEPLSDQLEEGYRQAIWLPSKGRLELQQPGEFYAARLNLTTRVDAKLYALFASEEEMYLCQESSFAWLRKLGGSGLGTEARTRLRRGYRPPTTKAALEKEADLRSEQVDQECAALPPTRLVLVVHGIGQQLSAANIAQDATNFRATMRQVAVEQGLEAREGQEGTPGRTEVLPVQWRKHLTLDIDKLGPHLMPPGVRSLREVLFATVVEVLLYLTPLHRSDIMASLVTALNSTYSKFMLRNPNFKGRVSIMAHSLGSVLCHDILCNQPPWVYARPDPYPALEPVPAILSPSCPATPSSPASWPAAQPGSAVQLGSTMRPEGAGLMKAMDVAQGEEAPREGAGLQGAGLEGQEVAALKKEVSRLRMENQRLALQLETAQAGGIRTHASPTSPPGLHFPGCGSPPGQEEEGGAMAAGSAAVVRPLLFSVDQLVLLGSPLSVFLALRGVNYEGGRGLGTAGTAELNRTAPGHPCSPDGLPAARRMYNLYHPFDPVGHRLEPLCTPLNQLQRPVFAAHRGGNRIHISVQEGIEDVSTAASRLGSSLLSSLAFSKFKAASRKALVGEAVAARPEDSGMEASVGTKALPAPMMEGQAEESMDVQEEDAPMGEARDGKEVKLRTREDEQGGSGAATGSVPSELEFGQVVPAGEAGQEGVWRGGSGGATAVSSAARTLAVSGAGPAPERGEEAAREERAGGTAQPCVPRYTLPPSALTRLTDGEAVPGSKGARGRLDFVLQESTLESQYLSALSSHFTYWVSPDVALFVLRAVHDLDVLTGMSKHAQHAGQAQGTSTSHAVLPGGESLAGALQKM